MLRQMASPKPLPGTELVRALSSRKKLSNTWRSAWALMPFPLSETWITKPRSYSSAVRAMAPPARPYLMALETRLSSTRLSLLRSAVTT